MRRKTVSILDCKCFNKQNETLEADLMQRKTQKVAEKRLESDRKEDMFAPIHANDTSPRQPLLKQSRTLGPETQI